MSKYKCQYCGEETDLLSVASYFFCADQEQAQDICGYKFPDADDTETERVKP